MSNNTLLEIKDLHAEVEGKKILKGINLSIPAGSVHAIMGPNGAGKSTLGSVIAGKEEFEVTRGEVLYKGRNILEMDPEERALEGVFMSFQNPVEIPGVSMPNFLRTIINAHREHRGEEPIAPAEFLRLMKEKAAFLGIEKMIRGRSVNEGFSGGEKKKNEMLQMMLLEPQFVVLDELDSGLDIDAIRKVSEAVNQMRSPDNAFLAITHYQRLLDYIVPDVIHILVDGRIVKSGDKNLALELEKDGYEMML